MPPGSSPLARGLPGGRLRRRDRKGIIPARAGFTGQEGEGRTRGRDHPRSRGVYGQGRQPAAHGDGSSPLARGLPHRVGEDAGLAGIIPARAGFTSSSSTPPRSTPDHPRSRGVYTGRRPSSPTSTGSSPLARGLPVLDANPCLLVGIIPARAGFTRRSCRTRLRPSDHPRSRGVYPGRDRLHRHRYGSSPLARGLRAPHS